MANTPRDWMLDFVAGLEGVLSDFGFEGQLLGVVRVSQEGRRVAIFFEEIGRRRVVLADLDAGGPVPDQGARELGHFVGLEEVLEPGYWESASAQQVGAALEFLRADADTRFPRQLNGEG